MSEVFVKVEGKWTDDPAALADAFRLAARRDDVQTKLIAELDAEIVRLREERRWIPVGERLPGDETWMYVAGPWGKIIGYYDGERWLNTESETIYEVTHFRELTPSPEANG